MQVLDRYLQAVSWWLPKQQQADIVAELRDDFRSEIEEKERALGHSLGEDEVCAMLERRGHPMWVAEAFLPQRHLIGPTVLPFYFQVLKVALPCLLAAFVVLWLVFTLVVEDSPAPLAQPGFWIWQLGLWAFAFVGLLTMIFALVERSQLRARTAGHWDPRAPDELPTLAKDPDSDARGRLRANAIAELVADLLVLSWWLDVQPAALPELGIELTPVWSALHWPVAAVLAASAVVALANVLRPSWSRARLIARLAVDGFALVVLGILLGAGPWVDVTAWHLPAATAAGIETWMNLAWLLTLLLIALTYAARLVQAGRRLCGWKPIRHWAIGLLTGD